LQEWFHCRSNQEALSNGYSSYCVHTFTLSWLLC
jgi:hypothetical protein